MELERSDATKTRDTEKPSPQSATLWIQRKLSVGSAHDPAELEADRIAGSVVAALQRAATQQESPLPDAAGSAGVAGRVHRSATRASRSPAAATSNGEVSRIQRAAVIGAQGGDASPAAERQIERMRSRGAPLEEPVRRSMEHAFGTDLGSVRVHEGTQARSLNDELGASAFTTGNDIFFRDGVPDASTRSGQNLLAHELTHTIQQGGSAARKIRRKASASAATLTGATLSCIPRTDTVKGHKMTFDLTMTVPGKAGVQKVNSVDAEIAQSVHGVTMEWWEEIVMDYEFKEADPTAVQAQKAAGVGKSTKPWSDIYLSNPQSQTFRRWSNSVQAAQAGTLSGTHVTGVGDNPGMLLPADTYKRRVLRFRINATDAHGKSYKFDAIQVLVVDNGVLTSSVYEDSAGNKLIAGTGEREQMRYSSTVPLQVRLSGDAMNFASQIKGKKRGVRPFVNDELAQVEKLAVDMKLAASSAELGERLYGGNRVSIYKELQQSNRLNGAPLIPTSDRYLEFTAADGGLLVAHVAGKVVKRMFHTKNVTRQITANVNGNDTPMTVREFEQLPPEMFDISR